MAYKRTTTTTSSRRRAPRRRYSRRPYRRRRTYRRRRAVARPRKIKLTRFALGQIDPFDDRVLGAKIPDANTTPSGTVVANDEYTIAGDGVFGVGAAVYRPWLKQQVIPGTAASANSWTFAAAFGGGTNSSRLAAIVSNYALVRPVAHGIRISSPVAPTSATGFVHVCLYAESLFTSPSWSFPQSIAQMNNSIWYKRYPIANLTQRSLTIVNKITDCSSQFYRDPQSDIAAAASDVTVQSDGFCAIVVAVEGVGVSIATQIAVENIVHYEALPIPSGVLMPSPAADFNPQELAGVSRISSTVDAVMFDGDQDRHISQAVNAILEGASTAMGEVAGVIGEGVSRAAYSAGYGAVNAAANYAAGLMNPGIPGVTNPRLLQY